MIRIKPNSNTRTHSGFSKQFLASGVWCHLFGGCLAQFQAALPIRCGRARHLPCTAPLCCFLPCITQAAWVVCLALSPAPLVAWGVGQQECGCWEGCGCPTAAVMSRIVGAGQEQGKVSHKRFGSCISSCQGSLQLHGGKRNPVSPSMKLP